MGDYGSAETVATITAGGLAIRAVCLMVPRILRVLSEERLRKMEIELARTALSRGQDFPAAVFNARPVQNESAGPQPSDTEDERTLVMIE